jgi:hypothetical protein
MRPLCVSLRSILRKQFNPRSRETEMVELEITHPLPLVHVEWICHNEPTLIITRPFHAQQILHAKRRGTHVSVQGRL